MDYAIIRLSGKQYRVREGETLVVDRVRTEEGKTFNPAVLLGEDGVTVTAKVIAHERGPKIRVGKYRRRTGYKRHNGFRAATTRLQISLGGAAKKTAAPRKAAAAEKPKPTPASTAQAAGLPEGYESFTVAQVSAGAKAWGRAELEAALSYERANAARKGAISALESALKKLEEEG